MFDHINTTLIAMLIIFGGAVHQLKKAGKSAAAYSNQHPEVGKAAAGGIARILGRWMK
jgi:hypothetical protein